MICPRCGTEIPDGSKFCLECGLHLAGGHHLSDDVYESEDAYEPDGGHMAGSDGSWSWSRQESSDEGPVYMPLSGRTGLGDRNGRRDGEGPGRQIFERIEPVGDGFGPDPSGSEMRGGLSGSADANVSDSGDDATGYVPMGREPEIVGPEALEAKRRNKHTKIPLIATLAVAAIAAIIIATGYMSAVRSPYKIDMELFPDEALRNEVLALDDDGDGYLSREQAAEVTELEVNGAEEVSGLGIFGNLQTLVLTGSELETVDVSDVSSLISFTMDDASVAELDLSGLENLQTVAIAGGDLETVDVSGATSLVSLSVCETGILELDLTGLANLQSVDAHDSELGSIVLEGASSVECLDLAGTGLESLDVSSCPKLAELYVDDAVVVDGIDATPLVETWTIVEYSGGYTSNPDGTVASSAEVSYDEDNRIGSVSYVDADGSGAIYYGYDDDGLLESVEIDLDGESSDSEGWYSYSDEDDSGSWSLDYEDGRLVSAVNYETEEEYSYSYDFDGRLSGYEAYMDGGYGYLSEYSRTFSYGDDGELVSIDGDDAATLGYDGYGRLTSYSTDDGEYSYLFSYDEDGRCVQVEIELGYLGSCIETFEYGSDGLLEDATRTLSDDASWSFPLPEIDDTEFEYDANGNLVSMSATFEGEEVAWCSFSYERYFTTEEDAPLGSAPVLSDPLWYGDPQSLAWTPWELQAQTDGSQDALLLVFDESQVWIGDSNPLTAGYTVDSSDEAEGEEIPGDASDGDGDPSQ